MEAASIKRVTCWVKRREPYSVSAEDRPRYDIDPRPQGYASAPAIASSALRHGFHDCAFSRI